MDGSETRADRGGKKPSKRFVSWEIAPFLVGLGLVLSWLVYLGTRAHGTLIATPDAYIPFLSANQNYSAYTSPWHPEGFGVPANGPLISLIAAGLEVIYGSPSVTQYILVLAPVCVAYLSAYYMARSYLALRPVAGLVGLAYAFSSALFNQTPGATGLVFIFAFAPFIYTFERRILVLGSKSVRDLCGFALAGIGATIVSTLAIFYILVLMTPALVELLLLAITRRHFVKSALNRIAVMIVGLAIYSCATLYTYFPWIQAAFFPSATFGLNLRESLNGYTAVNFLALNPLLPTYPNRLAPLYVVFNYGLTEPLEVALGLLSVTLVALPLLSTRLRNQAPVLALWVSLLTAMGLIGVIEMNPTLGYNLYRAGLFPLLAFNEPAEWILILAPWEIALITIGLNSSISKFQETARLFKSGEVGGRVTLAAFKSRHVSYWSVPVIAVIALVVLNIVLNVPTVTQRVGPASSSVDTLEGTYEVPNSVPPAVLTLTNQFMTEQKSSGPFRVLWVPTSPGIEQWDQIDPYTFNFPITTQAIYNSLNTFVSMVDTNQSSGVARLIAQLGIQDIVVLTMLNETGLPFIAQSSLGPWAILGSPVDFVEYLSHQPDFIEVNYTSDFVVYKDTEFRSLFSTALALLSPTVGTSFSLGSPRTYLVPSQPEQSSLPSSVQGFDLISGSDFRNAIEYWTPYGNNISQTAQANDQPGIKLSTPGNRSTSGFAISYNMLSPGDPNSVPAEPGQIYRFALSLSTQSTGGYIYMGAQVFDRNGTYVGYIQTYLLPLSLNASTMLVSNVTIPFGAYSMVPFIDLTPGFGGTILLSMANLTLMGFNSSYVNTTSIEILPPSDVPATELGQAISSVAPNSSFVLNLNGTTPLSSEESVVVPVTPSPGGSGFGDSGVEVLYPAYSLRPEYGYVGGDTQSLRMYSTSAVVGNVSAGQGIAYTAVINVSGFGEGQISIGSAEASFNVEKGLSQLVFINFSSPNSSLNLSIKDYVGYAAIGDLVIVVRTGQTLPWQLISGEAPPPPRLQYEPVGESWGDFMLRLPSNYTGTFILEASQVYSPDWSASYTSDGVTITTAAVLVDGWKTGFILLNSTGAEVSLDFQASSTFVVAFAVQNISIGGVAIMLAMSLFSPKTLLRSSKRLSQSFMKVSNQVRATFGRRP